MKNNNKVKKEDKKVKETPVETPKQETNTPVKKAVKKTPVEKKAEVAEVLVTMEQEMHEEIKEAYVPKPCNCKTREPFYKRWFRAIKNLFKKK